MAWNDTLTALNHVLAGLYPLREDTPRIVQQAGIPTQLVAFHPRGIDNWFKILEEADRRGKVLDIIRVARKDFPDNPVLEEAEKGEIHFTRGPVIGEDLVWDSQESTDNLEKIMGKQSTLLPISFLETGSQRARSVVRVVLANGSLGSGFLTHRNLLVTNHHVLPSEDDAKSAIIQFNYQKTADGLDMTPSEFNLAPEVFFLPSPEDDWTVVQVSGNPNGDWGAIDISEVNVEVTNRVNIIQHPGGGHKQIALYHNIVAYADEKIVRYLTDTLPGSSGSPVFNSLWELVALHHSGGWMLEPRTKRQVYRNEGINVNCIFNGLRQAGII